jgi:hypothetical protein
LKNTEFSFMADSSEHYIRRLLSYESIVNSLEKELDEQRYVLLYIIFEEEETEDKRITRVIEDYKKTFHYHNDLIKRDMAIARATRNRRPGLNTQRSSKIHIIPRAEIAKMLDQQQFLFSKVLDETIPFQAIDDLPFLFAMSSEATASQDRISLEYISFRLVYDQRLTPQKKYDFLRIVVGFPDADPLMAINYYILTLNSDYHDWSFTPDPKPAKINGFEIPVNWGFWMDSYMDKIDKSHGQYCIEDLKAFNYIMYLSIKYNSKPYSNFRSHRTALNFLDNYFSDTGMDENLRYGAALLFSLLKLDDYTFRLLESIYNNGTTHTQIIRHYIIESLRNPENRYSQIHQTLVEAMDLLSEEEWCGLFNLPMAVNYSILDLEIFRNLMCKHCGCE